MLTLRWELLCVGSSYMVAKGNQDSVQRKTAREATQGFESAWFLLKLQRHPRKKAVTEKSQSQGTKAHPGSSLERTSELLKWVGPSLHQEARDMSHPDMETISSTPPMNKTVGRGRGLAAAGLASQCLNALQVMGSHWERRKSEAQDLREVTGALCSGNGQVACYHSYSMWDFR